MTQKSSKIYFPYHLYRRFRPAFSYILSSYTCLHFRILRLHLSFYFSNLSRSRAKSGHIPLLWARSYYALKKAIDRGDLLQFPDDKDWLYLPGTDYTTLEHSFIRNSSTYRMWVSRNQAIGDHCHSVLRRMLSHAGFRQTRITPTFFLDTGDEVIPDTYTLTPIRSSFELKNGLSEIWSDPCQIDPNRLKYSDDYIQILNHFKMCKQNQIIPGFIGVKFDPSFYDFASHSNGLCFELGFQVFPPHLAHYVPAIAADLGFKNIVVVPQDPPFPTECSSFLQWLEDIKHFSNQ